MWKINFDMFKGVRELWSTREHSDTHILHDTDTHNNFMKLNVKC